MSTLHNRGPPAAWQGPRLRINQRTANTAVMPTKCHPSAQRECYLSPPSLIALTAGECAYGLLNGGQQALN